MLRTIFLLLLVHCCGGAITLEHPAGHRRTEEQWCIWLAGMVRRFLRDDAVDIIQFLQGPLGQPFSKPTNLLVGRLPMLKHHLYAAYDVTWRPTVLLGGIWVKMGGAQQPPKPTRLAYAKSWRGTTFGLPVRQTRLARRWILRSLQQL